MTDDDGRMMDVDCREEREAAVSMTTRGQTGPNILHVGEVDVERGYSPLFAKVARSTDRLFAPWMLLAL